MLDTYSALAEAYRDDMLLGSDIVPSASTKMLILSCRFHRSFCAEGIGASEKTCYVPRSYRERTSKPQRGIQPTKPQTRAVFVASRCKERGPESKEELSRYNVGCPK